MTSISVKELYLSNACIKYTKETDIYVKIKQHPYFLALKHNSSRRYNKYMKCSEYQHNKESGTWKVFYNIYIDVKYNGFDFANPDYIKVKYMKDDRIKIIHGRHRCCILYFIYGSKLKFVVDDTGVVVDILSSHNVKKLNMKTVAPMELATRK